MEKIKINSYDTLDDLMNDVLNELLNLPFGITSTRGTSSEIIGISLHLKNPRARLSRTETKGKLFSALGELLWYLSGTNDLKFITHYIPMYEEESDDGETVYGGYGPRLFKNRGEYNQIENVINLLREKPTSRRCVIQLFDAADISDAHKEIPCTCTMQFFIRNDQLHMHTSMRSNDSILGLPHDIFSFTMLQEIIARTLNVQLGEYYHSVGSLHLYEKNKQMAEQYLDEGFQSTKLLMPEMPIGNPWEAIKIMLNVEDKIRKNSEPIDLSRLKLDSYWIDLIGLLQIHLLFKQKEHEKIPIAQKKLNPIYNTYIDKRISTILQNEK